MKQRNVQKNNKKKLQELLSTLLNLRPSDEIKQVVEEYIEYNEYGLAFEHITYELHENGICISNEYFLQLQEMGKALGFDEEEYGFLKKLIQ